MGGALGPSVLDASPAIWPFNGLPDHLAKLWSQWLTPGSGPRSQPPEDQQS